jgi:hypothetical protein
MSLKLTRHVWLSVSALEAVFLLVSLASSAHAQTQASCQFSQTFSVYFSTGNASRSLTPRNVNDYGTVVGDGYDDTNFIEMGFFHWPDLNYTYYQHTSNGQPVQTFLYDRNDGGTTVGITLPGKTPMPFSLSGSTYTPLKMTISGKTYNSFYPFGVNRWGTIVGMYRDSSGLMHGFKRYSDGHAVALNYPGSAETVANGINDNGTIVGYYSKNLPPNEWKHGFIYSNGKWASLSYPSSKLQTTLQGISNSNLIVATTNQGSNALNSYIYVNGTFKKIVLGPGTFPTYAFGISRSKGLITGFTHFTGYVGTCK